MYDAVVIGIGGMGSATLYHLARCGCKAIGLERFGIPHAYGSSHGSTRMIRLAYSEGPEYVPLVRAAYRYWRELEEVSGQTILHETGGLDIGPEGCRTVEGSRASCHEHGIEFQELDGNEVNSRFPGYSLPPDMRAIYQRNGGYVESEVAIKAYAKAAVGLGAEIVTDVVVKGWTRQADGLRVDTTAGEIAGKRVVVTAGAWVGSLIPALRRLCHVERQVMLWTDPLRPDQFEPGRFPVFNFESALGRLYGFPNHCAEGFKFGRFHHMRQQVDCPEQLVRECDAADEALLRKGIQQYFPSANGPMRRMATCMFTNCPDGHFILDRYPGERDVFVAAGFSGHGFKFCSVIGKVMAEFCLDRPPTWDIRRFRLSRERAKGW